MRRVYAVIALVLVICAFVLGYYLGSKDVTITPGGDMLTIIKHRDSLQQVSSTQKRIEKMLRETLVVQKAKTLKSDSLVSYYKGLLASKAKEHGVKIAAVREAVKQNSDTTLFRRADNTWVHVDTPNSIVLVAQYDSVVDYAYTESQIISQQSVSIMDRDSTITTQAEVIKQKDKNEETFNGQLQDQKELTDIAIADAKKKKRQRNIVLVGAVVLDVIKVVVLVAIL